MTITEMEKEIIKALNINMKVDWISQDPIKEFKDLKKFVRELFKEYRNEWIKILSRYWMPSTSN